MGIPLKFARHIRNSIDVIRGTLTVGCGGWLGGEPGGIVTGDDHDVQALASFGPICARFDLAAKFLAE